MAGPITWQNIHGPDPRAAMLPMAVASQTLNSALSGLKDTFNQHQTDTKDRNTNAFMDALASRYRTPEEYQAAMASGEIEQLRASFGSMINHDEARSAPGKLLDQALGRAKTFDERADYTAERNNRGAINELHVRAARGDQTAIAELAQLQGVDVGRHVSTLQSSLNSHSSLNNAKDANIRANDAHQQNTTINDLNIKNLRRTSDEAENVRGAEKFLSEELFNLHRGVRPNAEGVTQLSPEEQSTSIANLIPETAERFNITLAKAREMVTQHDSAAAMAGRTGYGEKALTSAAMQRLEDAAVDSELEQHPFVNNPSDPVQVVNQLNEHIEKVSKKDEPWFGESERTKILREAAKYASKPWTYTGSDGKPVQQQIPLAAHMYAVQQTYDALGRGDVNSGTVDSTSYYRYLSNFMERSDTKQSIEKLEQLKNKRLARNARVGGQTQ